MLQPTARGIYIDATVGAGGHAAAILAASAPDGQLYGLDQDHNALAIASVRLTAFEERVHLVQANFAHLEQVIAEHNIPKADGIILDLGVSSMQLDQAERGFSFKVDAPLDMRMDTSKKQTAADVVNHWPQDELADLIYKYGEERHSRRIARAIIKARPIRRTAALANVVARAVPTNKKYKIHPATRTFQALRIVVNDELGALEQTLPQAIKALKPGGRLVVISFHSLEDRIVKHFFRQEAQDCICLPEQPFCSCHHKASVNILTKRPISATATELADNPRARSAKLRVVELKKE